MSCKLLFVVCAVIAVIASLEAASLGKPSEVDSKTNVAVTKLDYEGIEANVRSARQAYGDDDSGEDSDEDDDEDDASIQHENAIRRQQAYEQSVDDSVENSDEDDDTDEHAEPEDDDESFGRRLRRDVAEPSDAAAVNTSVEENTEDKPKPATTNSTSPNTYVLTLIRDTIKRVTELPNTQAVATSAQQYFQLFEHFLQQTIEQVIGDDDEDEDSESTTIIPESEKESESESTTQVNETQSSVKFPESDKESHGVETEKKPEAENEIKA